MTSSVYPDRISVVRHKAWLPCLALLLICSAVLSEEAQSGQLQFGEPVREGSYLTVPIFLHDDSAEVAAMDFRLQYDPQVFTPVSTEAGGVAVAAGKVVSANMTQPGEYTVVLMGLNRDTLGSGEVARIVLERGNSEFNDASRLTIADPTLATWEGQEIPSHGESRWLEMDERNGDVPEDVEEAPEENDNNPDDPREPGFLPQDPDGALPGPNEPSPLAGLSPGNAALDASEERDPDDLRRMAENIARNAAEAIRLRDQLPTPGATANDGGDFPGESAATQDVQHSRLAQNLEGDAALSDNDEASRSTSETSDIPGMQSTTAADETAESQVARQRAVSGLQWLLVAGVVLLLVLGLGVMRRHFLS